MDADASTGANYRLVVRGELGDRFVRQFEGMHIEAGEGVTVLTGHVLDQTQLLGLINRISELGIELLAVAPANEWRDVLERDS